jgi:hypothetical protein
MARPCVTVDLIIERDGRNVAAVDLVNDGGGGLNTGQEYCRRRDAKTEWISASGGDERTRTADPLLAKHHLRISLTRHFAIRAGRLCDSGEVERLQNHPWKTDQVHIRYTRSDRLSAFLFISTSGPSN